jgi:hypothetical protein
MERGVQNVNELRKYEGKILNDKAGREKKCDKTISAGQ